MSKPCKHAASGCDYPASECAGRCAGKQPEALLLAALLDATYFSENTHPAAAELRRLYDENRRLVNTLNRVSEVRSLLVEQRDELLEALQNMSDLYDTDEGCRSLPQYVAARAAIANATGEPQ